MKEDITFTLTIDCDLELYEKLYGDRWQEGFKGSVDEFCRDAQAFFDGHPFIRASKITRTPKAETDLK